MTGAPASVMTAAEIAAAVGGTVAGRRDVEVEAIAPLDRATARDLSFLATSKYAPLFERSDAGVVLVSAALAEAPGRCASRVVVGNPHDALIALIPRFYRAAPRVPGIHPTAVIDPSAVVGRDVCVEACVVVGKGVALGDRSWIGSHAVIGEGVHVGNDTRLYPHVTLYPGSVLGDRVTVHAGVRIGGDGFGYVVRDGIHQKVPHVGRCLIGNDVEIGANTTIDRGSIDDTVIGDGTKIDNLVQVAHNVRVGRLCVLVAQCGIAGSTVLEDGVIVGGQAGVNGHVRIGARARLAAKSGVFGDVPPGETVSGYPARPHHEALRASAALLKLAGMMKRLERLLAREPE